MKSFLNIGKTEILSRKYQLNQFKDILNDTDSIRTTTMFISDFKDKINLIGLNKKKEKKNDNQSSIEAIQKEILLSKWKYSLLYLCQAAFAITVLIISYSFTSTFWNDLSFKNFRLIILHNKYYDYKIGQGGLYAYMSNTTSSLRNNKLDILFYVRSV